MSYYRLYFLNATNGISRFVELFHDSDEAALDGARGHLDGSRMELWNRSRLVAQLSADGVATLPLEGAGGGARAVACSR